MKKRAMIIGLEDKAREIKKIISQNKLEIKVVDFWEYEPRDNNDRIKQYELTKILPIELKKKKIDVVIFASEGNVANIFGEDIIPAEIEKIEAGDFLKNFYKISKKVLYILTKADLGGVSKYLLEIIKLLPKEIMPYFIMSDAGYFSIELEKLGYKDNIFFVPMTNSILNIPLHIKSNLKTLKIIKKIKPDLIHCNSTTGGIIGRVCGFLTRIPVIFTAHGWAFTDGISKNKQIFYKILETLLTFLTKKIICVSEYDRQIALKVIPFFKEKFLTIHNGISDVPKIYKKTDFSKDSLKVVMISRFCPQKDPYTLILAVYELIKEGYNIELDLYGYGEELDKVLNCIKLRNTEKIQYKGEISDVTPILKNYDVYALISNWEGLPIGIIEAMRAGLPILVSDVGGNSECIRDNGYLVKRQDIMDCRKQLKNFLDNLNKLQELGTNSRKLYEGEFLAEKMIKGTLKVY